MEPLSTQEKYKGNTVIFVDDEIENLDSFRFNLDDTFEIKTYLNPLDALKSCHEPHNYTVLLVDQVMPQMSGIELAKEMKALVPSLTCIMITGNATKQLAIDAIKNGSFWDFLEKPVDFGSEKMRKTLMQAISTSLLEKTKVDYRMGTLELLANLIDDKDGHTHRHSRKVTQWAMDIGRYMKLSEKEMLMLKEGSMIHDIGKISIPDDILKKPGRLSHLERKIIMTHAARGGDILDQIPQLKELSSMARDHHERPDGKGYPRGLKGDEIPLLTSIVALADFFEALSSHRPYKEPWVMEEIVKEIAINKSTQFPEKVVDALFDVLEEKGLMPKKTKDVLTGT